jgi:nucleotide-binding universal stress UspA family protein
VPNRPTEVVAVTKVIAAIDGGLATKPVLASARAMGSVLHADVVAVHVRADGIAVPRAFASNAAVSLRVLHGPVLDRLIETASETDVAALVVGARGLAPDPRALGSTAAAVATGAGKPVVVVPPEAEPRTEFKRVLVPVEGGGRLGALRTPVLPPGHHMDVVVLHVLEPDSIPSFVDQPHHWQAVWTREFLARYCPWDIDDVEVHVRVGRCEELVAQTARETNCDLIALAWSGDLSEGHARVVRATLLRSALPVALLPAPSTARAAARATESVAVRGQPILANAGQALRPWST